MRKSVLTLTLVIAIAAAAVVTQRYRQDVGAAMERVAARGRLVATACGPIEYAEAGGGSAVLVVHGAGGGFDQGLDLGAPLVRAGYRVIAPSRFGYLRTPLPQDASAEKQADAHACLLDALGVERAAAVGASAGAPSTMQLCLRYPQRCSGMVLMVPAAFAPGESIGLPDSRPRWRQLLMDRTLSSDLSFWLASRLARDAMIETILATPIEDFVAADEDEQRRVVEVLRHIEPISRRVRGLQNDARVVGALPRYDLERIAVPTLIITTANDGYGTLAAARYSAEHIRGARLVVYPDGGHLLVGRERAVSAALCTFLPKASGDRMERPSADETAIEMMGEAR